jgi:hypothetical protein
MPKGMLGGWNESKGSNLDDDDDDDNDDIR